MNILFLLKFYQPFDRGGSEWSTHDLAKLLVDNGHSVTILTPNYGAKRHQVIEGINIYRFPFPIKLKNARGQIAPFWTNNMLWFFLIFIFCLYYVYKNKFDIIHIHSNEFIPAAVMTGYFMSIPTVATFRDYQAICPLGFCLWNKDKACNLKEYLFKDFIFFFENYVNNKNPLFFSVFLVAALRAKLMQTIIKFFSKGITYKVAVSNKVKKIFKENGVKGLNVIHNPVIIKTRAKNSSSTIVYVGKFSPGKGINLLVEVIPRVLKSLKRVRFSLIGTGQLEKEAVSKIRSYKVGSKVEITGHLSHEDVLNRISKAALTIVPSVWQEPLPRSAIESILSCTPVVASNKGGIGEVVKDNVYGILTSPSPDELEKNIIKAFKIRSKLKNNISNDLKTLKKHFSQDSVNSYLEVYNNLTK